MGACDEGDGLGSFDPRSVNEDPPIDNPDTASSMAIKFLPSADGKETYTTFQYQVQPTVDFSSTCAIATNETSNKDLSCVLDVNEQDLYFHGLRIEYVLPSGMCDYVRFYNHWHYSWEVGSGPPAIYIRQYRNDASDESGNPECFVLNSDMTWYPSNPFLDGLPGDGAVLGTGADCQALTGAAGLELSSINVSNNVPQCIYNHKDTSEGPNCCYGSYYRINETIDNDTSVDAISKSSITTNSLTYNGSTKPNYSKCLAGPAMVDGAWPKTIGGIPMGVVYYTRDNGIAERYAISAPTKVHNIGHNQIVANWHAGVEGGTTHSHTGAVTGRTSLLPIFHDPVEDRSGDFVHLPGQSPYEFQCLDEDFEIKHRIRWYVREYNTQREFLTFLSNPVNGSQDADRTGVEGGLGVNDCEGFLGARCNDRSDADDFFPNAIGQNPPYDCSLSEGFSFSYSVNSCFPGDDK
jgi:hypothetical protein